MFFWCKQNPTDTFFFKIVPKSRHAFHRNVTGIKSSSVSAWGLFEHNKKNHFNVLCFNEINYTVFTRFILFELFTVCVCVCVGGGGVIWSPADFVRLPTDKEMIGLMVGLF